MHRAVSLASIALILAAPIVLAEDVATTSGLSVDLPSGIGFNTSISINLPLTAADRAGKQAEEDAYRRDLYARSVRECQVLLDSIAKGCTITSISISTQTNSNPGQPDYLYASSNITMQVELK